MTRSVSAASDHGEPLTTPAEPVAIVGLGCRFPQSASPGEFWRLLMEGRDAVGDVPPDRWDPAALFDPDPSAPGKTMSRWGGYLDDVAGFDWRAFRVSPREAKHMDPQHRLLLELGSEALEDAGIPFESIAGTNAGVFVGIMWNDYAKLGFRDVTAIDSYSVLGASFAYAANRISYQFDLKGPSIAVDVQCASSLVALYLACQSLRGGESDLAIAGGVNLMIAPDTDVAMSKAGILSPTGSCKTWDADADGFVRGEGAGVVVLKPLDRAVADGDRIYAVVRSCVLTHGGRTDWIMAPSRPAQEALLRQAYAEAGIDPRDVDYVELHGTGTKAGDPVEAAALGAVIGQNRNGRACRVGTVKTNIGHLDSAAGMAGLIKTALAIHHRAIPPSLHLNHLNPAIDTEALGLEVQTAPADWPSGGSTPVAGVTGLSFGGGHAHVVLAGAPAPDRADDRTPSRPYFLPLSARSPEALRLLAASYRDFLGPEGDGASVDLLDVCHTAALRRSHHQHRAGIVARNRRELLDRLHALYGDESRPGLRVGRTSRRPPRIAFVFSGQGRPWWGSGWELLSTEPAFRAAVTEADRRLRAHVRWSLLEELTRDEDRSRVTTPGLGQPAMFALQVGLAELWRSFGADPEGVVGHSIGEVGAAWCAGILPMSRAADLAVRRGLVLEAVEPPESLAAVVAPTEQVTALADELGRRIVVAAENSPGTTVVAGDRAAVDILLERCAEQGVYATPLKSNEVFHRPATGDALTALDRDWQPQQGAVPFFSTLTGGVCDGPEVDGSYWARQASAAVRFGAAVDAAVEAGFDTFVELGVDPLLGSALAECLRARDVDGSVIATLRWGAQEQWMVLDGLAQLYVRGGDIDLRAVQAGDGRCVSLPTNPWVRERLWIDTPSAAGVATPAGVDASDHPLLGARLQLARSGEHVWHGVVDPRRLRWLDDHLVQGVRVFAGAGYVEMAAAAAAEALGWEACTLLDVVFRQALVLPDDGRQVQLTLTPPSPDADATFRIHSRRTAGDPWTLHVDGRLRAAEPAVAGETDVEQAREGLREEVSAEATYADLLARGEEYRSSFQGIERLWRRPGEVLAQMRAPQEISQQVDRYRLHPALGDACMHALVMGTTTEGQSGFMPVRMDAVHVRGRLGESAHSHVLLAAADEQPGREIADIRVVTSAGEVALDIEGLHLQFLDADALQAPMNERWYYEVTWQDRSPAEGDATGAEAGTWIVLADRHGVGDAVAGLLERDGHHCVVAHHDGGESVADALAAAIRPGLPPCRGVVHLWSLDAEPAEQATVDDVTAAQSLGCGAALDLLRALEGGPPQARVWFVTRGAQAVDDDDDLQPLQTPLWGFGRSVAQERPERWGGLLDLDPGAGADECARALHDHLRADDGEDQCAWRGGRALVARLEPTRVPPAERATQPWRGDATYVVTGGLGDLGLAVAAWMARTGARHLVLMGRTPLPPRSTWASLAEDEGVAAARVAAVRSIEALGASVHVASVDVGDEAAMRAFLEGWAAEGRPPIRGVIHCAGVAPFEALEQMSAGTLHSVLRPKVEGGWVLHRLLGDAEVFVLFASASGVLSSPRLAHYAAGNAFLDTFAAYRRRLGLSALSVAWGPWDEVGMATRTGSGGPASLRGMRLIGVEDGLDALGRLMAADATAAAVLPIEWAEWQQAYQAAARSPLLSGVVRPAAGTGQADEGPPRRDGDSALARLLAAPPDQRRGILAGLVRRGLAAVLRVPETQFEQEHHLAELGFDSLMAMEVRARLADELGVDVRILEILDATAADDLVELVADQVDLAAVTAADPAAARLELAAPDLVATDWVVDLLTDDEVEELLTTLTAEGAHT